MKKRGLIVLAILVVCTVVGISFYNGKSEVESVSIIKVQRQTAGASIYCNGVVEQEQSEEVSPDTTVAIDKVCIKEGDYVKKGDVLFEIDVESSRKEIFMEDSTNYADARKVAEHICAEESGYIQMVTAEKDTICPAEFSLATIIPEKSLQAKINVSEDVVSDVEVGQKVELTGSGFRDKTYYGTIKSITAVAKPLQIGNSTQTVLEAIVDIEKPDRDLKVGFNVKAKISVDSVEDAIVIPFNSVLEDEDGKTFVYMIKGDKAYKQTVKTGKEFDEGIRVVSGINIGDKVVCDNSLSGDAVAVSISEVIK